MQSFRAALFVALSLLLASAGAAQNHKLSPPLAREILGDVHAFRVSPDGSWVVYLASQESAVRALYGVPSGGGRAPVDLTRGQATTITAFEVGPGGRFVVYLDHEIFRVAADGSSAPLALHPPLSASEQVANFRLAPGGAWVVHRVAGIAGSERLYSARLDARGGPVLLQTHAGNAGEPYEISPDGARVVYSTGLALYGVPISGVGAPVLLNAGHAAATRITDLRIDARSKRAVYRADQDSSGVFELYGVPLDGTAPPIQLNPPLVQAGDVQQGVQLGAGGRVVYRADQEQDGTIELYAAPIDANGPVVQLNGPLVAGGDVQSFQLTPDGNTVLYLADEETDERLWLYAARLDGSGPRVRVGTSLGDARGIQDFQIDPAGARVAYRSRFTSGLGFGLYSSALARPGTAVPLSDARNMYGYQFTADGRRVVFHHQTRETDEVCSVPSGGGGAPTVLTTIRPNQFVVSPDGARVLFVADRIQYDAHELFSVATAGGSEPVKLNGALYTGEVIGDVDSFAFGPDGDLVFHADGSTLDHPIVADEVYRMELEPRSRPVRLFPWDMRPNDYFQTLITPDDARIVFTAGNDPAEHADLYSVPLDATLPAVQLSDPSGAYFSIRRIEVTADSRTVVYGQASYDAATDEDVDELYAVAIDRTSDPVELFDDALVDFRVVPDGSQVAFIGALGAGTQLFRVALPDGGDPVPLLALPAFTADVRGLELTPDGRRVVFFADLESDDVFELYSVPLDGSAGPVKHSGALVAGGDVVRYELSPDGARVAYLADQVQDGVVELFAAPLDGSRPAVKLNGPLHGSSFWEFRFTPGGRRIVYRIDQDRAFVFELWSVPSDGSSPAVKLNGPLADDEDVASFEIAADGRRVVFVAGRSGPSLYEIFSVRIAGAGGPVVLNDPLVAGGAVQAQFALSPDGRWVAYCADQRQDDVCELFTVPTDRSAAPRLRSGPLVPGGDVERGRFSFSPDGRRLLYAADQDVDDVTELYECLIGRPLRAR